MTTAIKLQLTGSEMNKVKDMVKGHRHIKNILVANYVKFEVLNEKLTITYTDLSKTTIELTFAANGVEHEIFLLPIHELKKLSTTKSDIHKFNVINTNTVEHIENGISQKVSVIESEQFPKMNLTNKNYIKQSTFDYNTIQQLKVATISVSKSQSRPVLTNVLLRNDKMISTDSHRLYQTETNFTLDQDVLIPYDIVKSLNMLMNKNDSITLERDGELIKLTNEHLTIYYDNMSITYPDVSRIIPQEFNTIIEINEYDKFKKTLESIKKASKNNVAMIHFDKENQKINLTDRNKTIQSEINIKCIYDNDSNFTQIVFSAEYMLDALKQLDTKQIRIKFDGTLRPFIIENIKSDNNEFSLVLPVRLNR